MISMLNIEMFIVLAFLFKHLCFATHVSNGCQTQTSLRTKWQAELRAQHHDVKCSAQFARAVLQMYILHIRA